MQHASLLPLKKKTRWNIILIKGNYSNHQEITTRLQKSINSLVEAAKEGVGIVLIYFTLKSLQGIKSLTAKHLPTPYRSVITVILQIKSG